MRRRRRRDAITVLTLNQQDLMLWVAMGIIEHVSGSSCCIKKGNFRTAEWLPATEEELCFLVCSCASVVTYTASSPSRPFIVYVNMSIWRSYNNWATAWTTEVSWFDSHHRKRFFRSGVLAAKVKRPERETAHSGVLAAKVKRPGRETAHSPPIQYRSAEWWNLAVTAAVQFCCSVPLKRPSDVLLFLGQSR